MSRALVIALLLLAQADGAEPLDTYYEKAVTACTAMLWNLAIEDKRVGMDETGHRSAYDAIEERCRKALGELVEH